MMSKRKEFNEKAKQLLADDDRPGLMKLAAALATERPASKGHWTEEFQQTIAEAAMKAARTWWDDGGNCHKKVCAAISTAARDFRGQGGYRVDHTWRGGYSTDQRKFSSQLPDTLPALVAAMEGEPGKGTPEPVETDDRDQRDAIRHAHAEYKAAKEAGNTVSSGDSSVHDANHADGERLDPHDDGEAGYGVDGAERGLNTGRVLMNAHDIAWQMAVQEELTDQECHFLTELRKVGYARYIAAGRKQREPAIKLRMEDIQRRLARRIRALLAGGHEELQAWWVTNGAAPEEPTQVAAPRLPDLTVYAPVRPVRPVKERWQVARDETTSALSQTIAAERKALADWLAGARVLKMPKHDSRNRWGSWEWWRTHENREYMRVWLAGLERYKGAGRLFRVGTRGRSLLDEV